MTTLVAIDAAAAAVRPLVGHPCVNLALLGCGTVGSALARLAAAERPLRVQVRIGRALVRDASRSRDVPPGVPFTSRSASLFDTRPDVVAELLGGVEPAATLVLEALARGIPVVTANKSLLARRGRELREAARAARTPLFYEAAVLAGVPFLGTFARRPRAAAAMGFVAVANGTSNYIVGRCRDGFPVAEALLEAQRLGLAEPDPRNDVDGIDAAEKLAVLLQHFAGLDVSPDAIERHSLAALPPQIFRQASEAGGCVKPVILSDWSGAVTGFSGPAFLPDAHPLARVDGLENALRLRTPHGQLHFQGLGAGPEVTAGTVLDDVAEIVRGDAELAQPDLRSAEPRAIESGWLLSLSAPRLPRPVDLADLLSSHGVYTRRATERAGDGIAQHEGLLTWPVERSRLDGAVAALRRAAGVEVAAVRALERGE